MNLIEYINRQTTITNSIIRLILALFAPFKGARVTRQAWNQLLVSVYPSVERARRESAELAREFYDSERRRQTEIEERYDFDLAPYEFAWFEEAMRPSYEAFRVIDTTEGQEVQNALRVAKEIENGGRRTMQYATEGDPLRPRWARVATGRETCAFCLMLISRGPIYYGATNVGVDTDDTTALELLDEEGNGALDDLMTRWHPGCDCKVVPVFNPKRDWPGKDQYKQMQKLWGDLTGGYTGRDKLNAFRRAVDSGQIRAADFAAAR